MCKKKYLTDSTRGLLKKKTLQLYNIKVKYNNGSQTKWISISAHHHPPGCCCIEVSQLKDQSCRYFTDLEVATVIKSMNFNLNHLYKH